MNSVHPQVFGVSSHQPSSHSPDYLIRARQREDQQRNILLERTMYYAKAEQVAQFEHKTTENITRNRLRKRFGELKAQADEDLERRRERLRHLLASDVQQWREALHQQEETVEQRVEKLRNRAAELRNKREDERKKVVEEKLLQRFRNEADELRTAESHLLCQKVAEARAAQLTEKREAALRLADSNARYNELWEQDRLKKVAREEEDRRRAKSRNEEMVAMLDVQLAELRKKEDEEDRLKKEEADLMRQQQELRILEEHRAALLKQSQQRATRESLDAFNADLRSRRAAALQQTRDLDLSVLQSYVRAEQAHKEKLSREREGRVRETQAYMEFLAARRAEEAEEERRMGRMYADESEKMWKIRMEGWAKEQEARERLMAQVLSGREEQLRDALARNLAAQQQTRLEQATLSAQIAAVRSTEEAERHRREEKGKGYKEELMTQMRQHESRRVQERQRVEKEAEEERSSRVAYESLLARELANVDSLPRVRRFLQSSARPPAGVEQRSYSPSGGGPGRA